MKKMDPRIRTAALYSGQASWGTPDATTLWLGREEASPWLAGINIHDFDGNAVRAAHSLGVDVVSPYYEELTQAQVDEAHRLGMKVVPWTVNARSDMEKMVAFGVDGMITDKPWVLREYLAAGNFRLRPKKEVKLPYHLHGDHIEIDTDTIENGKDAAY